MPTSDMSSLSSIPTSVGSVQRDYPDARLPRTLPQRYTWIRLGDWEVHWRYMQSSFSITDLYLLWQASGRSRAVEGRARYKWGFWSFRCCRVLGSTPTPTTKIASFQTRSSFPHLARLIYSSISGFFMLAPRPVLPISHDEPRTCTVPSLGENLITQTAPVSPTHNGGKQVSNTIST